MQPDHIVADALALQANDVFSKVLADIHTEALAALVSTDAADTDNIRNHQAMARAIESIRDRVKLMALTNAPTPKSGLA